MLRPYIAQTNLRFSVKQITLGFENQFQPGCIFILVITAKRIIYC